MPTSHVIELLGTRFTISTDEDATYFTKIIKDLRSYIDEITRTVTTEDRLKIAILAGILVVDENLRLQTRLKQLPTYEEGQEAGILASQLLQKIDALIEEQ